MIKAVLVLPLLALTACASNSTGTQQPRPIGVGKSQDSLRSSPCACVEQPNPKNLPEHLRNLSANA